MSIYRRPRARSNGREEYQAYRREKKALGWSQAKISSFWKRKKQAAQRRAMQERNVVGLAVADIYKLADRMFPAGHSDSMGRSYSGSHFLYAGPSVLDFDEDRKQVRVELPRSRDTRTKKGWSNWGVDTPEFISGLRKIQKKYAPKGLKMVVAVVNPKAEWKIFHADHGISTRQMDYIKALLMKDMPQGFSITKFNLPKKLGTIPNAMYGPASGDRPISESEVHYMDRAGRGWEDRMVNLPPRPVSYGQVIGVREGDSFTLFTVYGGPLAPQNVADPGNQNVEGSRSFWAQHALSSHQWAKANPFWVSPAGTAGYLSPDASPTVAGTRFGGHSRYKAKHPTRGRVPSFMVRQVRLESPREALPSGYSIVEVEVVERGQPVTHYKVHHRGRDTGKYARDWNKAVAVARKHLKRAARKNPQSRAPEASYRSRRARIAYKTRSNPWEFDG
jgi:hypothetical protein